MKKFFTEHPRSVNETYFQHLCFALKFSLGLFRAGFACWVHAFFPFLCQTTASEYIARTACQLSGNARSEKFCEQIADCQREMEGEQAV